ncbi:MFS transporter [Xanthovirga aplysinae]|uniref:MFS transporter n=1 Tax=Xanthovirga aplysinae TaxID=2529853 RepID=UPI0012BBF062|nr:MFS transporter [Xanthovirga aplysinae]MTI32836.1 MFS transporter [Xanthovirga aplysinae]
MARPELLDFQQERIRVLHYTWIAFFMTFFVWFNMAPLASTMLNNVDWLTKEHIKVLAICNVALTIPARIIVGALIDRYGPRKVFSALMVLMAIPALFFAFGNSFIQLLVSRLILGSIGAGFVIGIKMVANWFPTHMVGRAEGFYAGWGNFGSAFAAVTLPWIALTFFDDYLGLAEGWRYALALNAIVCLIYGFAYYFLVKDFPEGQKMKMAKKTEPMKVSSYGDLLQYLVWSFPLIGAMGVLAWKVGKVNVGGTPLLSTNLLYGIYGIIGLLYVLHVIKVCGVNIPHLKKGVKPEDKYHWGSVAALNSTYFANFGAELAVVSMLPMFFQSTFKNLTNAEGSPVMTATLAGLIAASFAFVNLFARPLGGLISDKMKNRKRTMLIYMLGIALGFLGMANIGKFGPLVGGEQTIIPMFDGIWWLAVAVVLTVACSIFVQGAEGATFAIIPMINKQQTGQIAGMSGAYGNVGAVIYLVIYSLVDAKTFFFIIAGGAALSFLYCLLFLKVPEEREEIKVDDKLKVKREKLVVNS